MVALALWAFLVTALSSALLIPILTKLRRSGTISHPDGLYIVSEPESGKDATFEIVAVHGLGAHAEHTWTAPSPSRLTDSNHRSRVHLLRDLLKHDFPRARILAFAHNSDWLIDAPVTTAQTIAERLLDGLVKHRRKHRCVPIAFIAHSFGGIILKEALCKPGDDAKEIVDSAGSIMFLGTPHQGSPVSFMPFLAARVTSVLGSSTGLLLSLTSHREKLSDLDERFVECMKEKESRRHKTEIVAFRETKPTRIFGWLSVGLVVPRDSARGGHAATTRDIDTDHSGLNKCGTREDKLYIELKQELHRLEETTASTLNGNQRFVIDKLRTVEGAAFDSHANQHVTICLKNTRHELLSEIYDWANNDTREHIYWLQGKAGTGKSTIARTIAQGLRDRDCLAASFFFKRSEADRGSARRLFPTIAAQLATRVPAVAGHMRNVIEADPDISTKDLGEQFSKLILRPVEAAGETFAKTMTVMIDALDECEGDKDVTTVTKLLLPPDLLAAGSLKFFVTSRLEPPIRFGFQGKQGDFIEFPLHKIPARIIERDIAIFLQFRFHEIRQQHNIATSWPSQAMFQNLLTRSIPLFIFAATACRFVENDRQGGGGPESRLLQILHHETYGDFDQTYLPALNQIVQGLKGIPRRKAIAEFKQIVGSIVTLSNPLGAASLATLLGISVGHITDRLQRLHSVLDIPTDTAAPVKVFHESFREYLIHPDPEDRHEFWIDEKATNNMLADKCLRLLSENGRLKQDLCGLGAPGQARSVVSKQTIDQCLPPEVQYATLYWVRHLKSSGVELCDKHQVLQFLHCHFLHWLEALSLIGRITESIVLIGELQSLINPQSGTETSRFLHDANRFILNYRAIIDQAPLQLYTSAFVFTPKASIIRKTFQNYSGQVSAKAIVEYEWSSCLQTLEGHSGSVRSVAFSADGGRVASASHDGTVKIWDVATGTLQSTLEGHSGWFESVAFSADGGRVASASHDGTVKIWDAATGILQGTLEGHRRGLCSVAFSANGARVASASHDGTVKIWDVTAGTLQSTLEGHSGSVESVAFSADVVASASNDGTVKIWDVAIGTLQSTLEGHSRGVHAVAFSADGGRLTSASQDHTVKIWDVATGTLQGTLEGHSSSVRSVAFSADGGRVASASHDGTVKIWDVATETLQKTPEGHSGWISSVAFSTDGGLVTSASQDHTVKIWDVATGTLQGTPEGHSSSVRSVAFSADGERVASASQDHTVKIWDVATGTLQSTLEGHSSWVESVAFSTDGRQVASASQDHTVKIWDAATGTLQSTLEGHSSWVESVAFSADGRRVASASQDHTVKIWDAATGTLQSTLEGYRDWIRYVAFSADGGQVASASHDHTVKIWDAAMGTLQSTLEGHSDWVSCVAFSADGGRVASASHDGTVKIWVAATGTLQGTLEGHRRGLCSVAFSANGARVASASRDHTVKIWDAATGTLQSTLEGHSGSVESVAFSADDARVASASRDHTVKIWDVTAGTLRSTLKSHSNSVTSDYLVHFMGTSNGHIISAVLDSVGTDVSANGYGIREDSSWITLNGNNLLWLPAEYRYCQSAISGSTIVLGCRSGRLLIMNLE